MGDHHQAALPSLVLAVAEQAAVLLAAGKQAEQDAADMQAAAPDIRPADPGCPVFCQEAGECLPRSR